MGLCHYSILNKVLDGTSFTIVDTNKKQNAILSKNLNAKILQDDNALNEPFDFSLVCTPPMFHLATIKKCLQRGDKNIFIEKPFGGNPDDFSILKGGADKCRIGYYQRYNPIIDWLKGNIDISKVVKVEGSYFSNTIEKKPKGWRNGPYSGVLNEMGSHIIDQAVFLFKLEAPQILDKNIESKISDVGDIVHLKLKDNDIEFEFNFNWIDKSYRKPVFELKIFTEDGIYIADQQKIELYNDDELKMKKTVVDLAPEVPYYLRGIDYTMQLIDFVGKQKNNATVQEALITRNLIRQALA